MKEFIHVSLLGIAQDLRKHCIRVLVPYAPLHRIEAFKSPVSVFIEKGDESGSYIISQYQHTQVPGTIVEHYTFASYVESTRKEHEVFGWVGGNKKGIWFSRGSISPNAEKIKKLPYIDITNSEYKRWFNENLPKELKAIWGPYPVNINKAILGDEKDSKGTVY